MFWPPARASRTSDAAERDDHNAIELAIRLCLIAILIYWTSVIVFPFAPIIAWSVIMAVALYPAFDWLSATFGGRPRAAATMLTCVSLLLVVGPVTWLGIDLIEASTRIIDSASNGRLAVPPPVESVKSWPLVGQPLYDFWALASTNARSALAPLLPQLRPLGEKLIEAVSSAGVGSLKFLVSVLVTGFLFLYAKPLVAVAENLAGKIDRGHGVRFVELAGATIRAVSRGVIGMSLLQAIVSGIGMSVAGVPAASVLTLLVLILGIVQIGPGLVTVPVMIWAWAERPVAPALALSLCLGAVSLSDALVKPFFLSHGLTTPVIVTFIGVIGGILAHGILGLFVGPIVVAVAWNLADAWLNERGAARG
ncbi:MAG: AI-2E family transporter [Methylocystis sp.]|uniref:AI-2E family transporter n=1 Tax=Methylocystis sp. TaxID=1911079 RepID=UPI003DA631C6